MKRMDIILFLPVLLFLSGYMVGQETRELQMAKQLRVSSMGFYGRTNDVLLWYGVEYMMSESPLSGFKDYKTLFGTLTSETSDHTSPIDWDKNYKAKWILMYGNLYLYDLEVLDGVEKYLNKRSMIEKLTHQTFQKELNILPGYPEGFLFASWFSDTIYVKRKAEPGESFCDCMYRCEPFKGLIFKEGKSASEFTAFSVDILIDSVEIYNNPLKYRVNIYDILRLDPCSNHLKENLTEEQYLWEGFFAMTSDEIMWNDTVFMCSESPLSLFENYKNIYPNIPFIEINSSLPQFYEKNYIAKWVIDNDRLYLYDIDFEDRKHTYSNIFLQSKHKKLYDREYPIRLKAVEELTGKKFGQTTKLNKETIFADWYNGTMYLKRYLQNGERMGDCVYKCEPFYKIIFDNGKIISKEKTNYMIITRDIK